MFTLKDSVLICVNLPFFSSNNVVKETEKQTNIVSLSLKILKTTGSNWLEMLYLFH